MKILLSGGGTGGHITPILAVAHELKKLNPEARLIYVGERKGKFADLADNQSALDEVKTIYSGKFRRYHSQSVLRHVLDIRTNLLNLRDGIYVVIGFFQSYRLLKNLKPDIVFLKGGFVGVPVGLAAAALKIPFVTHDSDAIPGLANRLVSRWAAYHATGMPEQYYGYPPEKTRYIGVLVSELYSFVTPELQKTYKGELQLPASSRMLLITGGSLGAQRLNKAIGSVVPRLLEKYQDLHIIHQVGKGNLDLYKDFAHDRLTPLEFMYGMHRYTGAADVVVTRAGANTLAELGVQGKACIVVPNPLLTGGHQLKNTAHLVEQNAVVVVHEADMEDSHQFEDRISELLDQPEKVKVLGASLHKATKLNAAHELAMLLLEAPKTP